MQPAAARTRCRDHEFYGAWRPRATVSCKCCCALAAGRLRQAIAEASFEYGPITVSIGAAALLEHVNLRESLVAAADEALADAKHVGKDQVVVARLMRKLPASFPAVIWIP